jgi:hypothetical protein
MPTPLPIRVLMWIWLLAAVYLANGRALAGQSWPVFAAVIAVPAILCVFAAEFFRGIRTWVDALDLRALVFLHATRLLAFFFITLHDRGELPAEFALPTAWGEIVVAAAALVLAVLPLDAVKRRRFVAIWNIVGFAHALFALSTAARVALAGDPRMEVFTDLPFGLLPTFLVPIVLASHVVLYRRLRREERSPAPPESTDASA